MTDRCNKRVYHGLRNLPPNELPSDNLSQSRFFNALHDAECPGGTKLVSPGFDAYIARISKEQKPPPHHKKPVPNTYSNSDLRTRAFLDMYGVTDPPTVVKSNYGTEKQNRLLACLYNPDRDTRVLPAGDIDSLAYRILTPKIVKQIVPVEHVIEHLVPTKDVDLSILYEYATVLEHNTSFEVVSSVSQPVLATAEVALSVSTTDSGFQSCSVTPEKPAFQPRPLSSLTAWLLSTSRPTIIRCRRVQLKIWHTGRRGVNNRKGTLRLGVQLRRRSHWRVGVHCLMNICHSTSDARNAGYGFNGPGN